MATCRECAYLRKCIDKATKEGYEHNVDFDPKDGCPGFGFKPNTAADTNADRIRAMSDEELAELLQGILHERDVIICEKLSNQGIEISLVEAPDVSFMAHLEWLKQPVDDPE